MVKAAIRKLCCESLEQRHVLSGITIVTHGFQSGATAPDWAITLGQAILDRADGPLTDRSVGSIYQHDPSSGQWLPLTNQIWSNSNDPADHVVLIYDWADESDLFQDGWLEAAADNLFASLSLRNENLAGGIQGTSFIDAACADPICDQLDFHFIGHSRGAVLNSLVTERFAVQFPQQTIDQVTSLDPHPAAPMNDPGYVDDNPNDNSRLFTYDNVDFADNYYRQDFLYELDGDFNGVFAEGAYNLEIPESVLSGGGSFFEHLDVHTWYYGTVTEPFDATYQGFSGAGRNNDGDTSFPEDWYGIQNVPPRDMTGFHFSEIGDGDRSTLPISGAATSAGAIESVVNGDFQLGADNEVPGWQFHAGELRADYDNGRLRLGAANFDLARHNTLYVPAAAIRLAFDYEVSTSTQLNTLEVFIGDTLEPAASFPLTTAGVADGVVALPAGKVGTAQTIEFRLTGGGFQTDVFFDNVRLESNPNAAGDFDGDSSFDCDDIDALVAAVAVGQADAVFDLDANGMVDTDDVGRWLEIAGAANLPSGDAYLPGDGNLDGAVDGLDFAIWNAHKFTQTAAWCAGDYDANGVVDGFDMLIWNANKSTGGGENAVVLLDRKILTNQSTSIVATRVESSSGELPSATARPDAIEPSLTRWRRVDQPTSRGVDRAAVELDAIRDSLAGPGPELLGRLPIGVLVSPWSRG